MDLPLATDLNRHAFLANGRGQALIVMTSVAGCPYCDLVRDHYLVPMMQNGELLAVQLTISDTRNRVTDFDGIDRSSSDISKRWQARFSPTLLFFDKRGNEVAERLLGIAVPDFYAAYLEERMHVSAKAVLAQPH